MKTEIINFANTHYGLDSVGIPYIVHPISVMKRIYNWGFRDDDMLVAAICQDLLKKDVSKEFVLKGEISQDLKALVSDRVFGLVLELTDSESLESFYSKSVHSLVIKVADLMENTYKLNVSSTFEAKQYAAKNKTLILCYLAKYSEIKHFFGNEVSEVVDLDVAYYKNLYLDPD